MKRLVHDLMLRAARPYVAGETLDDALAMAQEARARGCTVTLGYWHDEREEAGAVAARYLASLDALAEAGLDAHLAMKVPGLKDDPALIRRVLDAARERGIPVDIDSHAPEQAEAALAAAALGDPAMTGIALPGRWQDGQALAGRAAAMGLRLRLVKGSWPDPAAPQLDPAAGLLALARHLAGKARLVAVATHDAPLAGAALDRLSGAGAPHAQELLYGLPMGPAAAQGRARGVAPRIYIPYGHAWVPYSLRRALSSPATFPRLIRDLVTGNRDGLPPAA